MPDILMRYQLDPTGVNPDNLVRNEPHSLGDTRIRTLAPNYGAFFTKGCVIVDEADGRILKPQLDFSYSFLYGSASVKYGKEIVGAVLITNPDVSANVKITYQCLGGYYEKNIDFLVGMLETPVSEKLTDEYISIVNRPQTFIPLPHTHDLGDGTGFEFLIFAIDKLASVLSWADAPLLDTLFQKIDDYLIAMTEQMQFRLDSTLLTVMQDFKKNFTKEKLGLDKVVNMGVATEAEGAYAAQDTFNLGGDINNRYVTLRSLISFKEAIINRFASGEKTNIGRLYGVITVPTLISLSSMVNGATVVLDSFEATKLSGLIYDPQVFPDTTDATSRWSITKITNNTNNRGGVYQALSMSTGSVYSGVLNLESGNQSMKWIKQLTSLEADFLLKKLADHIGNNYNPHKVSAEQVLLGAVENLPVADKMTILSRKPVREYVTYDGLLLFMAAFLANNWQIDPTEDDADPNVIKNNIIRYTTMFAPCGANACDSQIVLNGPKPVEPEVVPPRDQIVGWVCQGLNKRIQFTDGLGGFYYKTEENSLDCGFKPPTANFSIRDMNGTLLGYGFPTTGNIDPLATVRIDDAKGIPACFIYPTATTGRTAEIRNAAGETIGFAVNV